MAIPFLRSALRAIKQDTLTTMSKTTVNTRTIDHIVHLTPPGTVDEVSEEFRKLGFTYVHGEVDSGNSG